MEFKRLNFAVKKEIDEKLRFIAEKTGLKFVKIISNAIEKEYNRIKELGENGP